MNAPFRANTGEGERLYVEVRSSLGQSMRRAMMVAGPCASDGQATRLTQDALSEQSGIARSSIAKYLASGIGNGAAANPDLRTLCSLADTLNVPPAFLLMRPDDWIRLASAAVTMTQALTDPQVKHITSSPSHATLSPVDRSEMALAITRRMGFGPTTQTTASTHDIPHASRSTQEQIRFRLGVRTTSALPPLNINEPAYRTALVCLCAALGASFR